MAVLEQLEPKSVFHFFEQISSIPHGSGNVDRISDFLAEFAKERNLEYYQDDTKNVIMIKEATPGYEEAEPIILQGHMDMVAVKKPDCTIDLLEEGLQLAVDGDNVYAKGTSLGGDDGIAVAYGMALMDADHIAHPRLELVITTEEETGMDGAVAIDLSMLKGKLMLNLDSEEEGIFLTSCAGGAAVISQLPAECEKKTGIVYELSLQGLQGGHSGVEIHKERGNANVLMGRLLYRLQQKVDCSIASIAGGLASNAIPRSARAKFVVAATETAAFEEQIRAYEQILQKELILKDQNVAIDVTRLEGGEHTVLTKQCLKKATALLYVQPDGVQAMSADIPGLVQTSLNLGILSWKDDMITAEYALRSSVSSECEMLVDKLRLLGELLGAKVTMAGSYPAWEYKQDSVLRERMIAVYRDMYGKEPKVEAIHAGLECGILAGKIQDLDCVSIGPDMKHIHTTEETLSIASTKRVWEFIVELLKIK